MLVAAGIDEHGTGGGVVNGVSAPERRRVAGSVRPRVSASVQLRGRDRAGSTTDGARRRNALDGASVASTRQLRRWTLSASSGSSSNHALHRTVGAAAIRNQSRFGWAPSAVERER